MSQSSGPQESHKHDRRRLDAQHYQRFALQLGAAGVFAIAALVLWGRRTIAGASAETILLVAALALAFSVVAVAAIFLLVASPRLTRASDELASIVSGVASGDLSRDLSVPGPRGTMGAVWIATQAMLDALRSLAVQLRDSSHENAARANEITRGCTSAADAARRMAATSSELVVRSTEMNTSLRDVGAAGVGLASWSARMAAMVHEGNLRNVALLALAQENRVRLEESGQRLQALAADTQSSATEIAALADASAEIRAFVTLVRKMARQSKLLALNAAMEAARAGEQGQGFAVVASEVRRLARNSADAADRTDELVNDVLERVARARQSSDHAVATVRDALTATELGLASFREVERGVVENEAWTSSVDEAASATNELVADITSRLEALAREGDALAAAISDVAAAGRSQSSTGQEIATTSAALREAAMKVNSLVATFRVEVTEGMVAAQSIATHPVRPVPVSTRAKFA